MGVVRRLMEGIDLAATAPRPELASGGCCLAALEPGKAQLVAWARRGRLRVDLRGVPGTLRAAWVHPTTGERREASQVAGGGRRLLRSPWSGGSALLLETAAADTVVQSRP
jgi:hypothetical protein